MTEQTARALAAVLCGEAVHPMPSSRSWDVLAVRADGALVAVEDHAGWVYHDREAYEEYQRQANPDTLLDVREWDEWDEGEDWAWGLSHGARFGGILAFGRKHLASFLRATCRAICCHRLCVRRHLRQPRGVRGRRIRREGGESLLRLRAAEHGSTTHSLSRL